MWQSEPYCHVGVSVEIYDFISIKLKNYNFIRILNTATYLFKFLNGHAYTLNIIPLYLQSTASYPFPISILNFEWIAKMRSTMDRYLPEISSSAK